MTYGDARRTSVAVGLRACGMFSLVLSLVGLAWGVVAAVALSRHDQRAASEAFGYGFIAGLLPQVFNASRSLVASRRKRAGRT